MQPFPIAYTIQSFRAGGQCPEEPPLVLDGMQTTTPPCFTLRSRRETGTIETANIRHVERWQTDSPSLQNARRDVSATERYSNMNPTPSRLYRENVNQSQPFVVPSADSEQVRKTIALNDQVNQTLSTIQSYRDKLSVATSKKDSISQSTFKGLLTIPEETYRILLTRQKQIQIDTLSENPYFEKYDVASDSRNIIRELRGSVSEGVVDRGVRQNQLLLRREMENRWLPGNYAENTGIDSLSAYELMRPRMNNQHRTYR